ncbi:MAG TPA: ATP-binding protein, partial [Acidimicrobiia bacterium]|nr:ATP-binding protein [Acidimicrobiia bacterium]
LSPVLVGVIAHHAGGIEGWRWAFVLFAVPSFVLGVVSFAMHEPPRGQYEKVDVLGEVIEDSEPAQPSMENAFARLRKIATIRTSIAAFAALGFGVFALGSLQVLYLNDTLHVTNIVHRGVVLGLAGFAAVPFLYPVGAYFDRLYRKDPARALVLVGLLILPSALFTPLQVSTSSVFWFVVFGIPQAVLTACAFAMVTPVLQAVCPYRLRGLGVAMGVMYVVLIGGFAGGILADFFTNAIGVRGTVLLLGIPTSIVGSLLLMNGARYIRHDLSLVVEELLEEQEEHRRRFERDEPPPVLQVVNCDFSYGPVQVLFDVNFEVQRGECVALLGTNGAGKSTILRVISGLGVPERGVVRLNGRNVTYVAPEQRARLGIVQLPGGKGVFPSLTVAQNLANSARLVRGDRTVVDARIEQVLTLFPELDERRAQPARTLSGGQQQMLALARVLLHQPEILLIDELSLGLAPVVVERLLAVIDTLRAQGQTMLIVEQSLNVALSIADRAIFLEKGAVRFVGSAQELVERDDLARAVFFGREGG